MSEPNRPVLYNPYSHSRDRNGQDPQDSERGGSTARFSIQGGTLRSARTAQTKPTDDKINLVVSDAIRNYKQSLDAASSHSKKGLMTNLMSFLKFRSPSKDKNSTEPRAQNQGNLTERVHVVASNSRFKYFGSQVETSRKPAQGTVNSNSNVQCQGTAQRASSQ